MGGIELLLCELALEHQTCCSASDRCTDRAVSSRSGE
jgi:hypothetical protein